jgi:putative FmdB family regulatory protein
MDYNAWVIWRHSMPLYSYRCDNCGVQFEQRQHFTDAPLVQCPECGEDALRKLYQPVGVVFKGSGFYATDHRSPSGQTSAKKAEKAEASPSSEAAPKTEQATPKPEKTTEG